MKQLVINADDYGLCNSVNNGIIECINNGIVSDLSFIINPPFLQNSIEILKTNEIVNIGVHLNFTMGKPLNSGNSTITDSKGNFQKTSTHFVNYLFSKINPTEIYEEGKTQIEILLSNGFNITHFDTHQNIHVLPPFFDAITELRKKYSPQAYIRFPNERIGLPFRYKISNWKRMFILNSLTGVLLAKKEKGKTIQTIGGDFFNNAHPHNVFQKVLHRIENRAYTTFELAVHPGFISDEISGYDTYIHGREIEFKFLSQSKSLFENSNIKLTNFNELIYINN